MNSFNENFGEVHIALTLLQAEAGTFKELLANIVLLLENIVSTTNNCIQARKLFMVLKSSFVLVLLTLL